MQESQISLQDLQNITTTFDPTVIHEDFLNQLLSGLQTTVSLPDITAGDGGHHHITATYQNNHSSFKSPIGDNNSIQNIQNLFHGFTNQTQQSFGSLEAAAAVMMTSSAAVGDGGGGGGGAPSQPRQRVRARRGQATDPHSIAERLRRERIAERMKALQELVPNANKADKATMLDDIIEYVKFLQLQVKVLSMSRLGGAVGTTNVIEGRVGGGVGRSSNGLASASNNDVTRVTEKQVVKLMEQDMGAAMQYLQEKGLCLMPISLATSISTATRTNLPLGGDGGEVGGGPSSPNMSVMTVQSANVLCVKDSA